MEYAYELVEDKGKFSLFKTWQRKDEHHDWAIKPHGEFYKSNETFWVSKNAYDILTQDVGIVTTKARAVEFEAAHDANSDLVYYLSVASNGQTTDDALKLIMGPILAELNARNMPIAKISNLIPAKVLNYFVACQQSNRFDKLFSKQILAEIFNTKFQVGGECNTLIDVIIDDPKFKAADNSEIIEIIKKLLADNPDQVAKAKENEKLVQWFVGQVMKASKGKANPQSALQMIKDEIAKI